jgi:tetratricopeptide (TPR) repeat protein
MSDIFKIQDEIASKVTQELKTTLLNPIAHAKTVNSEAYTLYLQAKQVYNLGSFDGNKNAEQLIHQSLVIDSTYAPSWVLLSIVIGDSSNKYGIRTIPEGLELGEKAALKAIALDPDYALGYAQLAYWNRAAWDFKAANTNLQKALQLAPDDAEVIKEASTNFMNLGKMDDAMTQLKKAILLDPINDILHFNLALYYGWNKQYAKAETEMQTYLLLNPNSGSAHGFMAQILLGQGKNEQALIEVEKDNNPFWGMYSKSMVMYALGYKKKPMPC